METRFYSVFLYDIYFHAFNREKINGFEAWTKQSFALHHGKWLKIRQIFILQILHSALLSPGSLKCSLLLLLSIFSYFFTFFLHLNLAPFLSVERASGLYHYTFCLLNLLVFSHNNMILVCLCTWLPHLTTWSLCMWLCPMGSTFIPRKEQAHSWTTHQCYWGRQVIHSTNLTPLNPAVFPQQFVSV